MEFDISANWLDYSTNVNNSLVSTVPVFESLLYEEFAEQFMSPNRPCIIKNVSDDWLATKQWLTKDLKEVNVVDMQNRYGNEQVLVYNCNERYFNSHRSEKMALERFLTVFWHNQGGYYLKDWHLQNTNLSNPFYTVPLIFASDWLNEFCIAKQYDDYRFVYMGQKNTWTPFHADVFRSFSWSVNVCGIKKWFLYPPGAEKSLRDSLGNLPFDVECNSDMASSNALEVIQYPGQAIFVPSRWYHQVRNLVDTISINHNWVNGWNIMDMWDDLRFELENVKREISDCSDSPDFINQCHILLKATAGMDLEMFYNLIDYIADQRLHCFPDKNLNLYHGHIQKFNHTRFDLLRIRDVLIKFLEHPDIQIRNKPFADVIRQPHELLTSLHSIE